MQRWKWESIWIWMTIILFDYTFVDALHVNHHGHVQRPHTASCQIPFVFIEINCQNTHWPICFLYMHPSNPLLMIAQCSNVVIFIHMKTPFLESIDAPLQFSDLSYHTFPFYLYLLHNQSKLSRSWAWTNCYSPCSLLWAWTRAVITNALHSYNEI